ncbi:ribonuclease domain-containing protein [Undibacterium sp. MH2W]|uniref:ribonuclease domain-containing protein n=1 Tax=Undibacterium sp. MH2W TaxID=3413044 RepID=UPI003BF45445
MLTLRFWQRGVLSLLLSLFVSLVFARDAGDTVAIADLPREAQTTLALIKQGGPFPYPKDGVVFGNYESRLPKQKRGYYHEYTVPTPGARNRGIRRIIAGGNPTSSGEYYYTNDHYESFRRIREE